jgi:hypothetical protein
MELRTSEDEIAVYLCGLQNIMLEDPSCADVIMEGQEGRQKEWAY